MKKEILRTVSLSIEGTVRTAEKIDLLVREGECIVLAGLNNAAVHEICGIFGGLGALTGGRLYLYGREIGAVSRDAMISMGVFFLDSRIPLPQNATLSECLFLVGNRRIMRVRVSDRVSDGEADTIFKHFRLPFRGNQRIAELSRAGQHLLTIVWAAVQHAKLIVLPDPEKDLTEREIDEMLSLILRLKKEGMTFLIGTSRAGYFFRAADQLIYMKAGRIEKKFTKVSDFHIAEDLMLSRIAGAQKQTAFAEGEDSGAPCLTYEWPDVGRERRFSLNLRRGRVLTVTSPDSALQERVWKDLSFGDGACSGVEICIDGAKVRCRSVVDLMKFKIATWAGGHESDRPIAGLGYTDNLLLPSLKRISRFGMYTREAACILGDSSFFGRRLSPGAALPEARADELLLLTARWEFFNPRAMLMWNVFSNADPEETEILKTFIKRITARGTAVLLIEVMAGSCAALSDEMILLTEDTGLWHRGAGVGRGD